MNIEITERMKAAYLQGVKDTLEKELGREVTEEEVYEVLKKISEMAE